MGFRDNKLIGYWGRIPSVLKKMGCDIYLGQQDSNADIETNGKYLAARINQIIHETGAERVNIIAHSKGGLDSRYAISSLNMGDKVASLTTISTPHHGSKTIDRLMKIPSFLIRFGCFLTDCWFRLLGDQKPNTFRTLCAFTTNAASAFNLNNPDCSGVLYQSYAFVMKKASSDIFMWLPYLVVKWLEGDNDGLVTPASAQWGNFKGTFYGVGNRGISHCDEIDLRRKTLSKITGDGVSDILDIYIEIVQNLIEDGV
jgi:triacylglycerol lipase